MDMRLILSADAVRPDETATERLRWAYDIHTTSEIAEATRMDACDYRGQLRGAVLDDCLEQMHLVVEAAEAQ